MGDGNPLTEQCPGSEWLRCSKCECPNLDPGELQVESLEIHEERCRKVFLSFINAAHQRKNDQDEMQHFQSHGHGATPGPLDYFDNDLRK